MLKFYSLVAAAACALSAAALSAPLEIAVETMDANGVMVHDAVCDLVNQNGSWRVTTPGTAQINTGGDWLTVKCVKGLELVGTLTSFEAGRSLAARRGAIGGASQAPDGNRPATKLRVMLQDATMSARGQPNRSEVQLAQRPANLRPESLAQLSMIATPQRDAPKAAPTAIIEPAPPVTPTAPSIVVQAARATARTPESVPAPTLTAPALTATTPPASIVQNVAKAVADFYDVKAVPYLTAQGRAVYADFRNFPLPRAFAIAKNGAWGWASRTADAPAIALKNCERRSGVSCDIYAVDKDVVWSGAM